MLKIDTFVFNAFMENTFLLYDPKSKECAVIDPGCSNSEEEDELKNFIEEENLKIKYILNTHCHIDHIMGNNFLKREFPEASFIIPEKDEFLLDLMIEQAANYGLEFTPSPKPDKFFENSDLLKLGDEEIELLFTPGHTPGEYSLLNKNSKICITGDVLFKEGIGRTDLWGGDYPTLISSIREKLLTLEDDIKIYPGHGESSTIGHEKKHNSFLR